MSEYRHKSRKSRNAARARRKPQPRSYEPGPSRRVRRAGTKTRVIGKSKSKPAKSRYSRVWKRDGKFQQTAMRRSS